MTGVSMKHPSRRQFIKLGALGAGTILLPGAGVPEAPVPKGDEHFFLLIVLEGGADAVLGGE